MCSYTCKSSGNMEHKKLINSDDTQYQKRITFTTILSNQISHINCLILINVSVFTTVLLIRLQLVGTVPYFNGKQHFATKTCREELQMAWRGMAWESHTRYLLQCLKMSGQFCASPLCPQRQTYTGHGSEVPHTFTCGTT
jgi:hypothetical protein